MTGHRREAGIADFSVTATPAPNGTRIALQFLDIAKEFWSPKATETVRAIDQVSFDIAEGEFVCLVGPSGCGKSTLLRLAAGLDLPSDGRVVLNRRDVNRPATAVAFQDYSIFPWKSVLANISFGLKYAGYSRSETKERALDVINQMGLAGFENAYPNQLSGGMKQRVALARAMAIDPEILLLDEPFAALDAQMRHLLQDQLLRSWDKDRRRSAILVTHSLDEAILLGDRIILMSRRPSVIKRDFRIPFERPRDPGLRNTAEFGEIRQMLWDDLEEEVLAALAGIDRGVVTTTLSPEPSPVAGAPAQTAVKETS